MARKHSQPWTCMHLFGVLKVICELLLKSMSNLWLWNPHVNIALGTSETPFYWTDHTITWWAWPLVSHEHSSLSPWGKKNNWTIAVGILQRGRMHWAVHKCQKQLCIYVCFCQSIEKQFIGIWASKKTTIEILNFPIFNNWNKDCCD